ncbi:hypothetical protein [Legionella sp. CNM-4043-24]|uniref:hypothetical protein n=1 Tax=Legionella sp. CNM-4043-24 TaxID=3421646 RepID=UPI00403A8E5D
MNDIDILNVFIEYYQHLIESMLSLCMHCSSGAVGQAFIKCIYATVFMGYFVIPYIVLAGGITLACCLASQHATEPEAEPEPNDNLIVNNMCQFVPQSYSANEESLLVKAERFEAPGWALDACLSLMIRPKLTLTRGVEGASDAFDVQGHSYDEKNMRLMLARFAGRCLLTTRKLVGEIDNTPLRKAILDWIKMQLLRQKAQSIEFFSQVDVRLNRFFSWATSEISSERMQNPCMALRNGQWVSIDEREAQEHELPYVLNSNLKEAIEYFFPSRQLEESLTLSFSGVR